MAGTLRKIFAVAALAFGESIRSRFLPAAAATVAGIVFAISRSVAPSLDDAGADAFQNFTFYSLAAVSALLYVSAIVSGAASVSGETRARTLQLARVKPISMLSFLVGRWLGLMASFGALLLFAFAMVLLAAPKAPEAFCFRRVVPAFPEVGVQAEGVVREAAASGVTDQAELARIRREALAKLPYATVPLQPGETWRFLFPGAGHFNPDLGVRAAVAFSSDAYSAVPLSASCRLESADGGTVSDPVRIDGVTARELSLGFNVPSLAGEGDLALSISNESPKDAMPLLMQPRQAVALLIPACTRPLNFLRAYAVMLPILALLLALGLALGSFFSLPVASFCATCVVVVVFVAGFSANDPDALEVPDGPGVSALGIAVGRVSATTVRAIDAISRTAVHPAPASMLASNEQIPARTAGSSTLWNGLLLPAAALLAASFVLERKELPQ